VYFRPAEGVPLELATGARGQKNYNDVATGPRKKFDDIFSRLDMIVHEHDGQTDRWTPDDSKARAYA